MGKRIRKMSGGLRGKIAVAFFVVALFCVALGLCFWMFINKNEQESMYLGRISELEEELETVRSEALELEQKEASVSKEEHEEFVREIEYDFIYVPAFVKTGDFVDVRIRYPDGSDYCLVSHKQIKALNRENGKTVIPVTEEENLMFSSAEADHVTYPDSKVYVSRYRDTEETALSQVDYLPLSRVYERIRENPNIKEISFEFNEEKRKKNEELLISYRDPEEHDSTFGDWYDTGYGSGDLTGLPVEYGGEIWD